MNLPRVSVIMPVYNRALYIGRAIDSVLQQSFADFELVIVDDASTDDTVDRIKVYSDARIRLIQQPQNRGAAAARNSGLAAARGDYIAFLDSDDEWLPEKLEIQVRAMERCAPDIGLVYTGVQRVWSDGTITSGKPRHRGDIFRALLTRNVILGSTSGAMIRKEAYRAVGGFDERLPARQDVDYWLRIARMFKIEFVDQPLVKVYHDDDTGRISQNTDSVLRGRLIFLDIHREELERFDLMHVYLRDTGIMYHSRLGDRRTALRHYFSAIRTHPSDLRVYIYCIALVCPPSLLGVFRRIRQRRL